MIQIGTVRFNSDTWEENQRWRSENNWNGCIYGLDKQIPDKVPYGSSIYIIEMNNTTNQIMGIGKIKYIFLSENRARIYKNDNYNRFIYKSNYRIDREQLLQINPEMIEDIEQILFKGSRHFKRGHGVIIIPHDRFGMIYKKKKRKRVQCAKCGNHGHNARRCEKNEKNQQINPQRKKIVLFVVNIKKAIYVQVFKKMNIKLLRF